MARLDCCVHRVDSQNTGDLLAGAWRYIDKSLLVRDVMDKPFPTRLLVLGGGGLVGMSGHWDTQLRLWQNISANTVVWGLGANTENTSKLLYPTWFSQYIPLVGVRDYAPTVHPYQWVPCPSCLAPQFNRLPLQKERGGILFLEHKNIELSKPHLGDAGQIYLTNDLGLHLDIILGYAQKCDFVITNSYHGAYWGTLAGCKVVVVGPWSSKFFYMKHPPVFCNTSTEIPEAMKKARAYPYALEECVEANHTFFAQVIDRLA